MIISLFLFIVFSGALLALAVQAKLFRCWLGIAVAAMCFACALGMYVGGNLCWIADVALDREAAKYGCVCMGIDYRPWHEWLYDYLGLDTNKILENKTLCRLSVQRRYGP